MPFGIENAKYNQLNFNYDRHYKKIGLMLKSTKNESEKEQIKQASQEELELLLKDIVIDIDVLKNDFINVILSENSSKYLWILYSKHKDRANYIDMISSILKQENEVIRGGTNTYKMNGWMAHTLYVYQIVNYNIANYEELINFNGNKENIEQIEELHKIYIKLSSQSKFLLKIFSLIHDIGVIEDIKFHDKLGGKYVEKVLKEIGITDEVLKKIGVSIKINDFIKILQVVIKYHALITTLSGENSDLYVENEYKKLLAELPEIDYIKKEIPAVLFIFAYADVIGVDEVLMDIGKYQRIKDCYNFFMQISQGKQQRDKEQVSVERICDMIGESKIQNLKSEFDGILQKNKIDKKQFVEDMYNIKSMKFTGPLMKTLNNASMTIKIYYELFELIGYFEGKEKLKEYTILFVPDRHENDFVEQFKNENFFKCINQMKYYKLESFTYGNINIEKGINSDGKYIHIRVV